MKTYNRIHVENRKWPRKILMNKNATRKIPKTDRDTRKVVQKRVSIFKGYKKFRSIEKIYRMYDGLNTDLYLVLEMVTIQKEPIRRR